MKRSDWITVVSMMVGIFLTTIGSVVHLSYKIRRIDENISSMEKLVERIPKMEIEIAEIKVKVDALWQQNLTKVKPINDTTSVPRKKPIVNRSL